MPGQSTDLNFSLGPSPELIGFGGTGSRHRADHAGWMWALVAAGLRHLV